MDELPWFKSSYSSAQGACVECARTPDGGMAIRDSKHTAGPALAFPRKHWQAFLGEIRAQPSG